MKLKLMIGIPSGDTWSRNFGMCLAMMMAKLSQIPDGVTEFEARLHNHKGSILPRSREKLIEQALAWQATHFLFLDSDQTFPADTLHRMLAHKKWVVAANSATKIIPATTTARQKNNTPHGVPVYTYLDQNQGLEKVWRVGTGIMLLDMRVFLKVPKPWFPITWRPEINDYEGEDWGFAAALEAAGIAMYIDHELSKEIGHVGEFIYSHEVVGTVTREEVA